MTSITRNLSPRTNPVLVPALLSLAYSIWQAIQTAQANGPLTWQQCLNIASGVALAAALKYVVRAKVTPVANPRDGNGDPLLTALAAASLMKTAAPVTFEQSPQTAATTALPAERKAP
jgi:hypothetical protein